ncbi:MAG: undecaprenyl-diphosphate phosphatase [Polaromonas sp.]|jgi:undecaprenyl-diphosphatase|uniref:undecaprenyl-diphosphate phosphatase n=1 Tax=Polaromonas sp. TaxID=1869339 RepID=UPI00181DC719|nr:undecaprenyl-diphosphate phosphatase [Polaromonas sp.]NMM09491.1 undecaprenyl-diphosphate phosphatase [Polaromonas sp.]
MDLLQILLLAVIQGAAELLPVSSSAHVIVAEKLMGLDPTAPEMTLLLVMLHTGTMFAVIVHFWKTWRATYFGSLQAFRTNALYVVTATVATGIVGLLLLQLIKYAVAKNSPDFEIEHLFGNARLMAASLAAAGLLIIVSSRMDQNVKRNLSLKSATWIGAVQGLCLPFRGFSRSGATISTGLVLGVARTRAEEFSFALAVVLTPAVIVKEVYRLYKAHVATSIVDAGSFLHLLGPSLLGMVFSFLAGLVALRWLSRWLEQGRWHFFGGYCLLASLAVLWVG